MPVLCEGQKGEEGKRKYVKRLLCRHRASVVKIETNSGTASYL